MKANFEIIRKIAETKKAITNHIDDKDWDINEGVSTEKEWSEAMEELHTKLDKLVNEATKEELFILLTGRYYVGDDLNYYYMENPSTVIPYIIGN